MNDIMRIIQALEYFNILPEGLTKAAKNKTREQRGGFLGTLVGTLGTTLLGNLISGKGIARGGCGNTKRKEIVRLGYGVEWDFLIPPHPLTNFEIQKYYQNEPRFTGAFSGDNLRKK